MGAPHYGVPHSSLVWKMLHFCDVLLFSTIFDHFGRFLVYFGVFRCNLIVVWCKKMSHWPKKWVSSPFFHPWGTKTTTLEGFWGWGVLFYGPPNPDFAKIGAKSVWGRGIHAAYIYMAASNGNDPPPHRGPTFLLEFFDTRDFSKKSVFGQRLGWGTAKNERILEKSR